MTEDFHSSIGMFAILRVVVALASTFTLKLLLAIRGDPLNMTDAMAIFASVGPEGLGIGAFPWMEYPQGRNALVIKKSDV
jgi:hypothetical protein